MKKISLIVILFFTICLSNQTYAKKPLKKNAQYTGPAIIEYDIMFNAGGFYKILNKCENDIAKDYRYRIGYLSWQDYVNYNQGLAKYTSSVWTVDKCDKDEMREIIEWYDQIIANIQNELNTSNTIKNDQSILSKDNIEEEIICEKYFRTLEATTGDLSLSITLPEDDVVIEFIYEKNPNNVWTINEMKLSNNINKIIENKFNKMFSNLKKTKKHKGNFTLRDFYNIYGFELNYIRYQNMNTNDFLSYVNQMSRKELNDYIDQEILLQKSFKEQISNMYDDAGDEIRKKINKDGYYVKFDRSSKKNGKLMLSNNDPELEGTIFDEGVKSIISENESQLNKSTTEFFGVKGDTIYKVIYEGNCGNQIDTTTNTNNNDDVSSKLQKLKSLFEDELITQEEYDAKRKEILDEM